MKNKLFATALFLIGALMSLAATPSGAATPTVATSGRTTCSLDSNGNVDCWGANGSGQLGNGGYAYSETPVSTGLSGALAIAVGWSHTCALIAGGAVDCWGANYQGQLGDNQATVNPNLPQAVPSLTSGVVAIAAGFEYSCALLADGTVQCWGDNTYGQLGNNSTVNAATPQPVSGSNGSGILSGVIAISANGADQSYNTCALINDGTVWCWGSNGAGQLGDGTTNDSAYPVQVQGLGNVQQIAVGGGYTCALGNDGTVQCWGGNWGIVPGTLTFPGAVSEIAAGANHTCGIVDGSLYCRGSNDRGQLGNGTTTFTTPNDACGCTTNVYSGRVVPVSGLTTPTRIGAIAAGDSNTCAIVDSGAVMCWGQGALGDGDLGYSYTPVKIQGLDPVANGSGTVAIGTHQCAVATTGALECWGSNSAGQLGVEANFNFVNPVPASVPGLVTSAVAVGGGHTCAVVSGSVYCWGINNDGQLGQGYVAQFNGMPMNYGLPGASPGNLPVLVPGLSGVSTLNSSYNFTCALMLDTTLKCWGPSGSQVNPTPTSILRQNGTVLSGVLGVGTFDVHSCAVLSDGTVECWGNNFNGQLGIGFIDYAWHPRTVPVVGLPAGNPITQIAVGVTHSCALAADTTVWCWGDNGAGQIGTTINVGTQYPVLIPTQVTDASGAALTNVQEISLGSDYFSCALIVGGGAVKCWGWNFYGQLGSIINAGVNIPGPTPVDVSMPAGVSFSHIFAGLGGACGLASTGDLYCWGDDSSALFARGPIWSGATSLPQQVVAVGGTANGLLNVGPISTLTVTPASVTVLIGSVDQTVTVGNALGNVSVSSLNSQIATANLTGNAIAITGAAAGTTTIIVSDSQKSFPINVTVLPISTLTVTPASITVVVGGTPATVTVSGAVPAVNWFQSVDISIAAATLSGNTFTITGNAPGSTSIVVYDGQTSVSISVTVLPTAGLSGNANFSNLTVTGGTLSTPFASGTLSYTLTVPSAATSVTVTPTLADPTATMTVNGLPATSGTPVTVNLPASTINVVVTAQNGTKQNYVLNVTVLQAQAIAFTASPPNLLTGLGGAVTATGGASTSPVVLTSASPLICSISNASTSGNSISATVTALASGNCFVAANQAGDTSYTAAPQVIQTIPIQLAAPQPTWAATPMVATGVLNTCALNNDGTVWCWGNNDVGQLGNNSTLASPTPVQVLGSGGLPLTDVAAITMAGGPDTNTPTGYMHACALIKDGSVQCWGINDNGQLGSPGNSGTLTPVPVATPVTGLTTAVAVAAGYTHTCAMLQDQTVQCWGRNDYGQLGVAADLTPAPHPGPVTAGVTSAVAIAAGGSSTCAVLSDGSIQCWGLNNYGQLGSANSTGLPEPVTGIGGTNVSATAVAMGNNNACSMTSTGGVQCWGYNTNGELGNGALGAPSYVPVQVLGEGGSGTTLGTVVALSTGGHHSCAINALGVVDCWGVDSSGQLGPSGNTASGNSYPVPVAGIANVVSIATAGNATYGHSCALNASGRVDCWGSNIQGELGNGTSDGQVHPTPTPVLGMGGAGYLNLGSFLGAQPPTPQIITFAAPPTHTFGDAPFIVVVTVDSGLPISSVVANSANVCTVSGGTTTSYVYTVTIVGAGSCNLTVNQDAVGYPNFLPASPVTQSFTVTRAQQSIIFGAVPSLVAGGTGTLSATGGASGNPVALSAGPLAICSLSGTTLTGVSAGVCTVTATQLGNANYQQASATLSVTILPPVILSGNANLSNLTVTGGTLSTPFASGTLSYTLTVPIAATSVSVTPTLADLTATMTVNGLPATSGTQVPVGLPAPNISVLVTAQNGAPQTYTLNITLIAAQSISFAALSNQPLYAAPFAVGVSASSGLLVALSSTTPFVCSVSGTTVTLLASGTCTINADQAGDAANAPAATVTQSFTVYAPIAAGRAHTCSLNSAGAVQCWGDNAFAQLGNGPATLTPGSAALTVAGLTGNAVALAAGDSHSCALSSTGTVQCWGNNSNSQLGGSDPLVPNGPIAVTGLTGGVVAIAAGAFHTCALSSTGSVLCWGSNSSGQIAALGNADSINPVPITSLNPGIIAIAAGGNHSCALSAAGVVQCWGDNIDGQLGVSTGVAAPASAPATVTGFSGSVVAIAAGGNDNCALTSTGAVQCWGDSTYGQLGVSPANPVAVPTPTTASTLSSGFAVIAAGFQHNCALMTTPGVLRCWGDNSYGQLGGTASPTPVFTPTAVTGLDPNLVAIAAGSAHSCALSATGTVQCWGDNTFGQLGDGYTLPVTTPVTVLGLNLLTGQTGTPTATGNNVNVQPTDATGVAQPLTLTFTGITVPGITTAVPATGPALTGGFQANGTIYNITTTAQYTAPVTVCLTGTFAATDQLMHYENGAWVVLPNQQLLPAGSGPYTSVCATTTSLSPFVVAKQVVMPQTVSFTSVAPTNATVGGATYTPTATATSGLPVTFAIDAGSTPGACSFSAGVVSFTGAGNCVIDANQAGNASFSPAPQVTQTIAVTATTAPAAPTAVSVQLTTAAPRAVVSWTDASTNETTWLVQRSLKDKGNWTTVQTLTSSTAAATGAVLNSVALNVSWERSYLFRVVAQNAIGQGVSATVALDLDTAPLPPGNVQASATLVNPNDSVTVTWTPASNNGTGFTIQRCRVTTSNHCAHDDEWRTVGNTGMNASSWSQAGAARATTFAYRVRAVNEIGNSAWVRSTNVLTP